jgi:hypothetical protein
MREGCQGDVWLEGVRKKVRVVSTLFPPRTRFRPLRGHFCALGVPYRTVARCATGCCGALAWFERAPRPGGLASGPGVCAPRMSAGSVEGDGPRRAGCADGPEWRGRGPTRACERPAPRRRSALGSRPAPARGGRRRGAAWATGRVAVGGSPRYGGWPPGARASGLALCRRVPGGAGRRRPPPGRVSIPGRGAGPVAAPPPPPTQPSREYPPNGATPRAAHASPRRRQSASLSSSQPGRA